MIPYAAGLDGGGTKTALEARSHDGTVLCRAAFGPMNVNGSTVETVQKSIADAMQFLDTHQGGLAACQSLCIGSAGVSNPDAVRVLTSAVRACGYKGPLRLVGDAETALAGALSGGEGAILIAGTGSICFGRAKNGQSMRTGGYGHLIDDEGSGYALGRDALAAVVRAHDTRIAETALTGLVLGALQADTIMELVRFTYAETTGKKDIAALAPLVDTAAEMGDAAAKAIVQKAGNELFALCAPVLHALHLESARLALCGSILTKSAAVRAALCARLASDFPLLCCTAPEQDAASGAALLALLECK